MTNDPAEVSATIPRVHAADAGDQWTWVDDDGRRHYRAKSMPPLPAIVNVQRHGRDWLARDDDHSSLILLLPPTN